MRTIALIVVCLGLLGCAAADAPRETAVLGSFSDGRADGSGDLTLLELGDDRYEIAFATGVSATIELSEARAIVKFANASATVPFDGSEPQLSGVQTESERDLADDAHLLLRDWRSSAFEELASGGERSDSSSTVCRLFKAATVLDAAGTAMNALSRRPLGLGSTAITLGGMLYYCRGKSGTQSTRNPALEAEVRRIEANKAELERLLAIEAELRLANLCKPIIAELERARIVAKRGLEARKRRGDCLEASFRQHAQCDYSIVTYSIVREGTTSSWHHSNGAPGGGSVCEAGAVRSFFASSKD